MGDPTPPNETLSTGAIRQQVAGRGRYDLMSVIALEQDAKLYEWGLHHRGERNWEKGIPYSRCIRSIFSHLLQFMLRENDPDHGNCLAAIRFWSAALMHYEEMIRRGGLPESLDDRPRYPRKPEAMEGRPLRIYVSGPISSPDESVFLKNHRRGQMFGKELRTKGHLVFCPHDHVVRSQGQTVLPKNEYENLLEFDCDIIKRWAEALYFIAPSPGADRELDLARRLGLKVFTSLSEVPDVVR